MEIWHFGKSKDSSSRKCERREFDRLGIPAHDVGGCPATAKLAKKTPHELTIEPSSQHAASQLLWYTRVVSKNADTTAGIGSMISAANTAAGRSGFPTASVQLTPAPVTSAWKELAVRGLAVRPDRRAARTSRSGEALEEICRFCDAVGR